MDVLPDRRTQKAAEIAQGGWKLDLAAEPELNR
jgi:hypothetical protein